jgi:hypothetical protein
LKSLTPGKMTITTNHFWLLCAALSVSASKIQAQCGTPVQVGSSANMLTVVNNITKPVAVSKQLNTVAFIHRNDNGNFGGNSGQFRYDLSMNGGGTWSLNLGVLNQASISLGRYPNVTIHNPMANTDPNQAYVGYLASTIPQSGMWDGVVSGVRQLNGTGNTENYNQPGTATVLPAGSLVRGGNGIYWSVGEHYNGTTFTYTNTISVFKGTWNGSNDITWTTNTLLAVPANTYGPSYSTMISAVSIAFDPSGNIGWISMLTNLIGGPGSQNYYPVFYKTMDGGSTWSGPEMFDLSQYSCITSSISSGIAGAAGIADLTVDTMGSPHMLVPVGVSTGAYGIQTNLWHHLFDITKRNGFWTAWPVADLKTAPETFNAGSQLWSPHVSRNENGSKIFFSWSERPGTALGAPNSAPDFFAKGFDINTQKWTQAKNFSACNTSASGKIFFAHVAAETLEPSLGQFELAPVYAKFLNTADDMNLPCSFMYLDGCTFSVQEFTIPQAQPTMSTQPGLNAALCPGSTITLSLTGAYNSYLWSTGSTSPSIQVSTSGQYFVAARQGCNIGTANFTVGPLSVNISPSSQMLCVGETIVLNAVGNASSYTWAPVAGNGASIAITPTGSASYTLTGQGNTTCTATAQIAVAVDACVGLEKISNEDDILVYPVPSNEMVYVKMIPGSSVGLVDLTGRTLKTFVVPASGEIKFEGLSKGVYFISATIQGQQHVRKVIVE